MVKSEQPLTKYNQIIDLWNNYCTQTVDDIRAHLGDFRIVFAYNSGKIENDSVTYHDTRIIFQKDVSAISIAPKAIFQQQNQKRCYEYIIVKLAEKAPLSLSLIRELHALLITGTLDSTSYTKNHERAGEFKKHSYITGRYEVGAPPQLVQPNLEELLAEVEEFTEKHKGNPQQILRIAAYFHSRFENIHPFADGNGRVGRTLVNYYLLINNHPPFVIFEEDKHFYYECLEAYDTDDDIQPLLRFFVYQLEKTWDKKLQQALYGDNIPKSRPSLSDFASD